MEKIIIDNVPYYSQRNLHMYKEMGFPDLKTANYWESRTCGIACLKMVVEVFEGNSESLYKITEDVRNLGGYDTKYGWHHKGLIEYAEQYSIQGFVKKNAIACDIISLLKQGYLVIASVGVDFLGKKRCGHLALVKGVVTGGVYTSLIVNNPSPREAYEYQNYPISLDGFYQNHSGNIIALRK